MWSSAVRVALVAVDAFVALTAVGAAQPTRTEVFYLGAGSGTVVLGLLNLTAGQG